MKIREVVVHSIAPSSIHLLMSNILDLKIGRALSLIVAVVYIVGCGSEGRLTFNTGGFNGSVSSAGVSRQPAQQGAAVAASLNPRIINGSPVSNAASESVVPILISGDDGTTLACSGVYVGQSSVMTAAHCVVDAGKSNVEVLSPPRVVVDTSEGPKAAISVSVPASYREDRELNAVFNDIAIITLAPGGETHPLPLVVAQELPEKFQVEIFGYGIDENLQSGELRMAALEIQRVTNNHLITVPYNGEGGNACSGDSGAPALISIENSEEASSGIVGLVSSGTTVDCQIGDTTFFTNLQNAGLVDFLLRHVPDLDLR